MQIAYHQHLLEREPEFNSGTIKKVDMVTFEQMWAVLYKHGASSRKEEGTRRYWEGLRPEQQEQVFTTITAKLAERKFVQYDPIRAIMENLREVRQQVLTYNEYYERYGTTEEKDGWKMANPTGQKVIYVKGGR